VAQWRFYDFQFGGSEGPLFLVRGHSIGTITELQVSYYELYAMQMFVSDA